MENFGNYLKNERESRGVPLEEIADNTKINMRFLLALENNNYDQLPGEVFIKGYIRSYAKSIGGNAEEILAIYDESVGKLRKDETSPKEKTIAIKQDYSKQIRWVVLGLGFILIFALIFFGFQKLRKSTPISLNNPPSTGLSTSNAILTRPKSQIAFLSNTSKQIKNSRPFAQISSFSSALAINPLPKALPTPILSRPKKILVNTKNQRITQPEKKRTEFVTRQTETNSQNNSPLDLTIRAKERSWFKLLTDGTTMRDFILPAGTGITFKGKKSFQITIGNLKGVYLTLNGLPLDVPVDSDGNNVIRDYLIPKTQLEKL